VSRRAIVLLAALAAAVLVAGIAGGLLVGRRGRSPALAEAAASSAPLAAPAGTAATSSTTAPTSSSSSTSTTAGLAVQAAVAERREDGLLVRWSASAPVRAVLTWGVGAPSGHSLAVAGRRTAGLVLLPLATAETVTFQVRGRAADGRVGASAPLTGRRLVRRVVLAVAALRLDIPAGDTGGATTGFLGTTYTFGPGLAGPVAAAEPYAYPATPLDPGTGAAPFTLRLLHKPALPPGSRQQSGTTTLSVGLPAPGRSVTLYRTVTAVGITAHLKLKVTVSQS
jgi:hypothetical protein